jgi:hypothetical protein
MGGPGAPGPPTGGGINGGRGLDPEERDGEGDSERREGCIRGGINGRGCGPIGRSYIPIGVRGITGVWVRGVPSMKGGITGVITGLLGSPIEENPVG